MRLYERDGMTHVEWVDDKGRQRRSLGVPWKSDPTVVANAIAEVFNNVRERKPKTPALEVIYNRALATHYRNHRDLRGVESKWKHDVARFFGAATPVGDITEDHLDAFCADLFARGNHAKTVNRKIMVISKLLHLAHNWRLIDRVPKMPLQREDEGRVRWLSDAEESTALAFLRSGAGGGGRGPKPNGADPEAPRLYASDFADAVEVLIDCGFRLGEFLRIEDRYLDFARVPVTVHLPGAITKSGKPRSVGITTRAAGHFATRLRRDTKAHDHLPGSSKPFGFLTQDRCGDLWELTREAMGLQNDADFVIHALRHTFAVRMLEGGVDIRVVQYLLGHTKADTTAIYAHVSPRLSKGAVDALEARAKDVPQATVMLKLAKSG